ASPREFAAASVAFHRASFRITWPHIFPPGENGPARTKVQYSEVPDYGAERGTTHRTGARPGKRSKSYSNWACPARYTSRRTSTTLERAARGDEPRRPPARARVLRSAIRTPLSRI